MKTHMYPRKRQIASLGILLALLVAAALFSVRNFQVSLGQGMPIQHEQLAKKKTVSEEFESGNRSAGAAQDDDTPYWMYRAENAVCDVTTAVSYDGIFTNYSASYPLETLVTLDKIPSLPHEDMSSGIPFATCHVDAVQTVKHFPHTFQQITRCWSFFETFPKHQPVLSYDFEGDHSEFNRGIREAFRAAGVDVRSRVPRKHVERFPQGYRPPTEWFLEQENTSVSCTGGSLRDLRTWATTPFRMADGEHARTFRSRITKALDLNVTGLDCPKLTEPRITILNRKEGRELLETHLIKAALREEFNLSYTPPEVTFDGASFKSQVKTMTEIDILISPHGAQLTSIIFMPKCAGFIEFYPAGYGHKHFFGTLAAPSGVKHAFLYLGEDIEAETKVGKATFKRRQRVRAFRLCPNLEKLLITVRQMYKSWQSCCRSLIEEQA